MILKQLKNRSSDMKRIVLAFFMFGLFYQNSYSCEVQLKNGNSFSGSGSCRIINDKVYLGTAGSISFYRRDVMTIDGQSLDAPTINPVNVRPKTLGRGQSITEQQKQEVGTSIQNNDPNLRKGNQYPAYYPANEEIENSAINNTKCVEETMRATGKPRDEVIWACNEVLSKPTDRGRKLPRTYEEKMTQREDILKWGLKYNVPSEEVKKVMDLYGVFNIPEPEKVTNVNPNRNDENATVQNDTLSPKEVQKEKSSIPGSEGEAWIDNPDGTRKRTYP